ncbi:4-hydroxythreonine-4-phosphate dehydrogenase PdxA [Alteraurantiacibacter aquimixticola]|uniref:4-hydroxythreonine-4-phosphate dehydrogenase n=1 Tax=Alteraurantiacibacter aquimixticola TaxID=2489173 RepID=A0A4T3F487_9SPHN|nr:4-hydroxythreonine-4-phosphate dehydrogenase PdxA [Alteraurantiacibacter aquimixticola]TIX51591.1 4-hydroxythreonine-4-phosphate dehydrogenase PdxA [Alteraurantiacibacter aquimixticola]
MNGGVLAISLGDPAGIGPEIIAEAWAYRKQLDLPPFMVVGGQHVLTSAAASRDIDLPVATISAPQDAESAFPHALPVLDMGGDGTWWPGKPTTQGAELALGSLELAVSLALTGSASGMVTAPVSKSHLADIGFAFPGQTEFIAHSSGIEEEDAVMMLAGPSLRAVPLTIHCALSDVSSLLTQELILRRCRVIHRAMQRDFGLERPRLALAGLNPHAGEKGRMGHEEEEIIAPAIAQLRDEGIDATGPHPADTMFAPHKRDTYDVAVAMYHDQALVPLKALDFDQGVNMTLGLPIVRTSPDHGTAFDIAGKGLAKPDSLIAAIRMASEAAAHRAASA